MYICNAQKTNNLMKKTLIFIILLTISGITAFSQTIYENCQDGKIYFKLKDNVAWLSVDENQSVNLDEDAKFLDEIRKDYQITKLARPFDINDDPILLRTYLLDFNNFDNVELIIEKLKSIEIIEYAEKVPLDKIVIVPNDPLYSLSYGYNWNWHLDKIKATLAWNISTGSPDIKVAVVDNAIWLSHPDLADKVVAKYDVADGDNNPGPPIGGTNFQKYLWSHGTHCAGLVGAKTNNNVGIASIGYNVSIIAVKAAKNNTTGEYTTHSMAGVQWAVGQGADVVSLSLGSTQYSQSSQNYFNALANAGVVVVASAGNDGNSANPKLYPAAYNNVIAVGSTNWDDKRSSFSQYGTWLDISAPGGYYPYESSSSKISILSTTYCDAYAAGVIPVLSGQKYDIMQGTSMSCPIVAGLCGLILSANPSMSAVDVKNCVLWSADEINSKNALQYAGKMGAGRINALAALQCATSTGVPEINEESKFVIYPNPVTDFVNLKFSNSEEFYKINIFNSLGSLIKSIEIVESMNEKIKIDVSMQAAGTYYISLISNKNAYVRKILIIK